jgi:hypothetical protein
MTSLRFTTIQDTSITTFLLPYRNISMTFDRLAMWIATTAVGT